MDDGSFAQYEFYEPGPDVFGHDVKQLAKELHKPFNTCAVQIQNECAFIDTILDMAAISTDMKDLRKKLYDRQFTDLRVAWKEFKGSAYGIFSRKSEFPSEESYMGAQGVFIAQSILETLKYFQKNNLYGLDGLLKQKPRPSQHPQPAPSPASPALAPGSAATSTSTTSASSTTSATSTTSTTPTESCNHTPMSSVTSSSSLQRKDRNTKAKAVRKGRVQKKIASKREKTSSGRARDTQTRNYWHKRRRGKKGTV